MKQKKDIVDVVGAPYIRQAIQRGMSAWEQDDFSDAFDHFEAILKENPNFADVRNKAGLCLAMMGETNRALAQFDMALEANEAYAEAHLNRAIILNEMGRFDEAKMAFQRASALDTRDGGAFPSDAGNRLAISHAKTGDLYMVGDAPERASHEFEEALGIRPRYADIRSKLAEAYLRQNRLEDAKTQLELILGDRDTFTGARVKLGLVLHRLGDDEGARREWNRCREEDPEDMRIRAFMSSLADEEAGD